MPVNLKYPLAEVIERPEFARRVTFEYGCWAA